MADLCQGLPQGNCTFLAASGRADTTGHPLLCLAQSGAEPWHPHGGWQCHPAGLLQDCIQLVPAGILAKQGADPGAQDPQLGLEQDLPSPFPAPHTPQHSRNPLPTLPLSPALLQHQCSLCTWFQLGWVAPGTPHPALGLGTKYSSCPRGAAVLPLQASYLQGSRWDVS